MHDRITQRLAQLQQEQQQTQQQLATLEQERQMLLQTLIGQQYALGVLQALLEEGDHAPCVPALDSFQPVAP